MKKFIIGLLLIFSLFKVSFAQEVTRSRTILEEEDGSPSFVPYKIKVNNTTLTNNNDGTASIDISGSISISDTAYAASWDGVTTIAPSKNAIYDKIETLSGDITSVGDALTGAVFTTGDTDSLLGNLIGIGATAPSAYLNIKATSTAPSFILKVADTSANDKLVIQQNGNTGIATTAPVGLLQIGTSPNAGLLVTSTGNVGIGNTNPAPGFRMEVTGDLKVSGNQTITGNLTAVTDQTVSGNIIMADDKFIGLGTSPAGRLLFDDTTTDEFEFLNGNVGIGTTAPAQALDVSGTANATTLTESGNAVYNSTEVPGGELGGTWASPTVDAIHSGSAHHSAVTVSGVPDYITLTGQDIVRTKLDISDDTNATGGIGIGITANNFTFDATELSALTWSAAGSAQYSWTYDLSGTDPKINFNNNAVNIETGNFGIGITAPLGRLQVGTTPGTPLLIVQDAGNVGIGTSTPTYKLDIVGSMRSDDTLPIFGLSIYNPDSSFDGASRVPSLTDTMKVDSLYTYITAGTNVVFTLKVGVTGTGPYTNLLVGSTATTTPLTVTSFVGGGTIPAGQVLILDTVSTSGTGTNTMYNLTVQGRKAR